MKLSRTRVIFSGMAVAAVLLVMVVHGNKYYMENYADVAAITRATPVSQREDLARRGAPPPPDYWENPNKYEPFRLLNCQ